MTREPDVGLAEQLASDVSALVAALRSPFTWLLCALLVALVLAARRLRRAVAEDRRLTPRVRAVAAASLNAFTVAVVASVIAWFLSTRAPLLFGIALAVVLAAASLGIGLRGRAFVWALATIWRGRVRIGDSLRFGAVEGTVVELGVFGLTVIDSDGARVYVPHARLAGDTFAVASPEQVHPAEIAVRSHREFTDGEIETLRRIGVLCPYRQAGAAVAVSLGADRRAATLSFRAWSAEGAHRAGQQVRAAFSAALSREIG